MDRGAAVLMSKVASFPAAAPSIETQAELAARVEDLARETAPNSIARRLAIRAHGVVWEPDPAGAPSVEHVETHINLVGYTFDELQTTTFPRRPAVLCHEQTAILRAGDLAQVAGLRGLGKSRFVHGIALAAASGGSFLRWHAPEPVEVALFDGELPGEQLKARVREEADRMGVTTCPLLRIVAADWQVDPLPRLDTPEGMAAVAPHITPTTSLVILDNRSCLFDPEGEKDPTAWAPTQSWILSLRRRGIAVVLVHHANRQGTARGHSKAEDILDVSIKLSRPSGYVQDQGARFVVEFDKARSFYGPAAEPFVAQLTEQAWVIEGDVAPDRRGQRIRDEVLAYLATRPGATKAEIVGNVTGREQDIRRMVDDLGVEGVLRKSEKRWWVA